MSVTAPQERIATYAEFWPFYLSQHANPTCRMIHYIGTTLAFIPLILAVVVHPLWLIGWPVCGYGFAWYAHFFVERNRPATFTYPLWSLLSDYKMFFKWLTGGLGADLEAAGINAV